MVSKFLVRIAFVGLVVSLFLFVSPGLTKKAGGTLVNYYAGQYTDATDDYGVSGYVQHANPPLQYPAENAVAYWIEARYPRNNPTSWAQVGVYKGKGRPDISYDPHIYTEWKYTSPNSQCTLASEWTRWERYDSGNRYYLVYQRSVEVDPCGYERFRFNIAKDSWGDIYTFETAYMPFRAGFGSAAFLEVKINNGYQEQAGTSYWGTNGGIPSEVYGLRLFNSNQVSHLWTETTIAVNNYPPYQRQQLANYYSQKAWGP